MDELISTFTVAVPDGWYVRDKDASVWEASTGRAVREQVARRPDLAPAGAILHQLLMDSWQDADQQGAIAAATLWEPSDDGRGATAATLVVLAADRAEPEDDRAEIAALLEVLTRDSEADLAPRQVQTVELPAGPAVRLRRLTHTDGAEPGEGELVVDTIQHWVPCPGGQAILVLVGSTPCLDVADELAATFDAIAGTLEFGRPEGAAASSSAGPRS